MKKGLLLAALFLLGVISTSAQTSASLKKGARVKVPPEKASPVRIARLDVAPVIDGRLDEDIWKSASVFKDFYQTNPGDNIAPSLQTELLVGYDSKFLYFAFRAEDKPGQVRATIAKRDDIFNDDYVGFYLDTFNDQRKAYALFFNPLGIQADGILTEGSGEDYSVDIVMESKGVVTDNGFIVEVAVPFKSLRYEAGKGKLWGIHVFRRIKRFNNELNSWMPLSRNETGSLNQAGHITGLEGISTERTLEVIPSVTLSETGRRVRTLQPNVVQNNPALADPGRMLNEPIKFDPGVTAKFSLSPNSTIDLAVNPDFAQVEADATVVTANQRFPIFFEEKRPFFLEGIDIFQTPLQAVHTRAIVDPDVAFKLTGKRGRNTYGFMLASDNAPGNFSEDERLDTARLPVIERFIDKNAYIGVMRLKRDVGAQSTIGLLATTYNFIEKHNQLLGIDGRIVTNPQTVITFQAIGTSSRRCFFNPSSPLSTIAPGAPCYNGSSTTRNEYRTGNGFGYTWTYDVTKRNYGWFVGGYGRTSDYRADVGFTPRINTNEANSAFRYSTDPKANARFINWRLTSFNHINYDWQGRIQIWELDAEVIFNLAKQSYIGGGYEAGYERLFEEEFGAVRTPFQRGAFAGPDPERSSYKNHYFLYGGTTPSKLFSIDTRFVYRDGHFDLDFGAGPKFPRVSPAALADPNAPLDPGPGSFWETYVTVIYQPTDELRMSLDYTKNKLTRHDTGLTAFDENIFAFRSTYQFTRFTFARARIDYDTLATNIRGQFLLGWTPNPGTAFYVGYNDDLNRNGFNPFTGQIEPGFRRNGRTFFIKMSYLYRRSF